MAKFSISLPDPLTDQLDQQVILQNCGRSKVIQDALSAYLEAGASKSKPKAAPEAKASSHSEEHPLHKTVQAHQSHLEELTSHLDSMREAMAEMIRSSGATLSDTFSKVLGHSTEKPAVANGKAKAEPKARAAASKTTTRAAAPVVKAAPAKRGPKPGAKAAAKAAAAAAAAAKAPAAKPVKAEEAPRIRAKPGPKPKVVAAPAPTAARAKTVEAAPAAPAASSRWQIAPRGKPKK